MTTTMWLVRIMDFDIPRFWFSKYSSFKKLAMTIRFHVLEKFTFSFFSYIELCLNKLSYISSYWRPDNCLLVITGNFPRAHVENSWSN